MIHHTDLNSSALFRRIKKGEICFAGNKKLKIYGNLNCSSGKRMKKENRVFFSDETDAIRNGYRPCGHCKKVEYNDWK